MSGPGNIQLGADTLTTRFAGARQRLVRLVLTTSLVTLFTLGLYRFWARTRLRRWYWSSIRPGGLPLEYTGNGFEKFTGFLIAVLVLTVWFALVNLAAMFTSLNYFAGPTMAYVFIAAPFVPLWFWSRYKSRAYMLNRTRWRGVRFGMDARAWGYALRACFHWGLTILSLGLLWPRMTYRLEAFRTERTYYGDRYFAQGGQWTMLVKGYLPAYLTALAMCAVAWVAYDQAPEMAWAYAALVPVFLIAVLYYRVRSLRLLSSTKSVGKIALSSGALPRRVLRIVFFNGLAMGVLLVLPLLVLGAIEILFLPAGSLSDPAILLALGPPGWAVLGLLVVTYFVVFLFWSVLRHALITMPVIRHYAETLSTRGAHSLPDIGQSGAAAAGSADGFAEALDFGGGI